MLDNAQATCAVALLFGLLSYYKRDSVQISWGLVTGAVAVDVVMVTIFLFGPKVYRICVGDTEVEYDYQNEQGDTEMGQTTQQTQQVRARPGARVSACALTRPATGTPPGGFVQCQCRHG
jgi:hypothetical protein